VTVEASSPALIERVRTAVSDSSGQYRIVELRPGIYTVTFTLAGFATVVQKDLELTPNFTATVNAELRVGELAETISVSGQSPVVDIVNTRQTQVVSRTVLDTVPTGREWQNIALLTPGMNANRGSDTDVGGQKGQNFSNLSYHGSSFGDQKFLVDGFDMQGSTARGADNFSFMDGNYSEYVIEIGAQTAESPTGGPSINMLPRDGGNTFSGSFYANFANTDLASTNITDELRRAGLRNPNNIKLLYRVVPTLGGPIRQDRLWFYLTYTRQVNDGYIADNYWNLTPGTMVYTPDLSRPAVDRYWADDMTGRLTWQATHRNKITAYYDFNPNCHCPWLTNVTQTTAPDTALDMKTNTHVMQFTWSSPVSNRLLFDAGVMYRPQHSKRYWQPEVTGVRITETTTGRVWGPGNGTEFNEPGFRMRGSMSYVTGAHATKFGVSWLQHTWTDILDARQPYNYNFVNGVPDSVVYLQTPNRDRAGMPAELGIFAQDQWRVGRASVNLGLRFDYLNLGYPEQTFPPTSIIPVERVFTAVQRAGFKDISPRFGLSYDLFGTGKTAIKASVNRYVGFGFTSLYNMAGPLAALGTDVRRWTDVNGNFNVDADPTNPAANGELGPRTNGRFAEAFVPVRYDPDYVHGWGTRPSSNWEFTAGIQHELVPRVSVNAGYFRRVFTTFEAVQNAAVGPADFDPFCVTIPRDSRLPGGGGQQLCGLYDLKPDKVGRTDPVRLSDSKLGGAHERWHGVDVTVDARPSSRLFFSGGVSAGKTRTDVCNVVRGHPEAFTGSVIAGIVTQVTTLTTRYSTDYCHLETPFQGQVKFLGAYTLPGDFRLSGTWQTYPGPIILANAVFTNAQIAPSLGRPLTGASTATISIVEPGTMYGDGRQQLDFRISKIFRVGRMSVEPQFDLYNALNENAVTTVNTIYGITGATWQVPLAILPARLAKFGVQMTF
jgi:hypothetical protein